jgi:1-acyl-sn-glycerol-3-phosphate acyltransferase
MLEAALAQLTKKEVPDVREALGAIGRFGHRIRRRATAAVQGVFNPETLEQMHQIAAAGGRDKIDPFGFDPDFAKYAALAASTVYTRYFRGETYGIENVPPGRVLLVSNHSGQLPLDAVAIVAALLVDGKPPRVARSMVEKWSATLPFVGEMFARCGQIVGVPENCIRLLEMEEVVLVFPEGVRGLCKPFDQRYRLAEFGLGFVRMALATKAPIVPVAVVGAEEQYISVGNLRDVARLLGAPAIPVIPQFLVPGGFLPLPTKYRIYFGEPMTFQGDPDDDDAVIEEKVWLVKSTIQSMLNRGLKERKGIFF